MATQLEDFTECGSLAFPYPQLGALARAANKSPRIFRSYGDSARLLNALSRDHFGTTSVASISRNHTETFVAGTLGRWRPTTAAVRRRSLQRLFKWLAEKGEVPTGRWSE